MMLKLNETHPFFHETFEKYGFHSVRRSSNYWAGLSTDLVIEQTVMRSIKGRGGLTRGRGFTETVRSLWVNTAHHMADVDMAMSSLLGLNADDSEHVEVRGTRVRRDYHYMQVMSNWLKDNDPFDVSNNKLRSLLTGVTAGGSDCVNCDTADEIGHVIHEKMDKKSFLWRQAD
jgi:hypothetical protein